MKIAVYSAFYGDRDPLNPDCLGDGAGYDRFLFTDDPGLQLPGVTVRVEPARGLDLPRASRRQKLRPARYFPDHDWSLYLDNTASLRGDPRALIERLARDGDAAFFAFPHFLRDCAYEEAEACLRGQRDSARRITEQMAAYEAAGYPRHAGLIAGTVLIRRHDRAEWNAHAEHWYEQVLTHSRRDQLSCNFTAWQMGLRIRYLEGDLRDTPLVLWPAIDARARRADTEGPKPLRRVLKGRLSRKLRKMRRLARQSFLR